jgi:cytochrome oxidase Cu insertion factor (SCO1/SenC/PrrC family)
MALASSWPTTTIVALATLILIAALATHLQTDRASAPDHEYWGTEIGGRAAAYLAGFEGKAVALTFIDPACRDTCPMTAAAPISLQAAYPDLVLVGINVNPEAPDGDLFGLKDRPNWHFITGERVELEPVWRAYGVASLPGHGGKLEHTSGTFLIDRKGMLRVYVNDPPRLGEILRKRLGEL